jgi:hypothetical protein
MEPKPDVFDVALPLSASDGVPSTGAGNLETTSSEDVYRFATTAKAALRVEFSDCASSLSNSVSWRLLTDESAAEGERACQAPTAFADVDPASPSEGAAGRCACRAARGHDDAAHACAARLVRPTRERGVGERGRRRVRLERVRVRGRMTSSLDRGRLSEIAHSSC